MLTEIGNSLIPSQGIEQTGNRYPSRRKSCISSLEDIGILNLPNLVSSSIFSVKTSCKIHKNFAIFTLIQILDQIFSHLTPTDLLTLRLTCHSTKLWIEDKFLDKLSLHVHSQAAFATLLQSNTAWTNFHFHWKLTPSAKQFSEFNLQFSSHISTLTLTSGVVTSSIVKIISVCSRLRVLIIQEIDGTILAELCDKDKARFSLACSCLQHLGILEITRDPKKGADFFINHILSYCTSTLKSVVIPFLTFSPISAHPFKFKYSWDKSATSSATPTDALVVKPLIELLENRDASPELESIVVSPESRSSLSDSALFCLTLMCYQRRLNLVYDKFCEENNYNLGRLGYSLSSEGSMEMSQIASRIMTVMASTTDILLNYEFANLRKLVVQFSTFHIDQDIFVVQRFPRLTSLQIDFKIGKQFHTQCSKMRRMDMFVQGLLEVERPSVRELQIQNHGVVGVSIPLSVGKVVACFVNLRVLSLTGFKGEASDFARIWRGLRLLEKVELDNCPGCSDKGILGEDWTKPAILELTGNCSMWRCKKC